MWPFWTGAGNLAFKYITPLENCYRHSSGYHTPPNNNNNTATTVALSKSNSWLSGNATFQSFLNDFWQDEYSMYVLYNVYVVHRKVILLAIKVKNVLHTTCLGWSFTTSLNDKVAIWWGFFKLTACTCTCTGMTAGALSLKKPYHITTLSFSKVVNDHPNNIT